MIRVVVRAQPRRTHCQRGHAFTPDNTYTTTSGARNCRTCIRIRQARNRKPVQMTCPECGQTRMVVYQKKNKKNPPEVCQPCSTKWLPQTQPVPVPTPVTELPVGENLHTFWRDRFTQDEIDELWAAVSLYLDSPSEREAA